MEETFRNTLPSLFTSKDVPSTKRRQTIHGKEIGKVPKESLLPIDRKKISGSDSHACDPSTSLAVVSTRSDRRASIAGVLKGTLKRRVSTSVLRHKMKKFQDYSLPNKQDNIAYLQDICNVQSKVTSRPPTSGIPIPARSTSTAARPTASRLSASIVTTPSRQVSSSRSSKPQQPSVNATPVRETVCGKRTPGPPPKPPRQRPPKNTTPRPVRAATAKQSSPVWRKILIGSRKEFRPQDHDLQQKIDHEIKMREGTARLLSASKHPAQVLEAAKNLLSSNTRIIAYMTELQRRKTAEVMGKQTCVEGNQLPCRAQVSVSDIRIPLMWKDADHFKNKGDYRRYAVFCMLKVGTEIYDTSMISNVDRSMTDITFEDIILFEEVPHDFEMQIEVYCHKLHEEFSVASTPKKIRKKINDLSGSVGRSVGKRLSGLNDADVIGNMVLGPKFESVAKGSLRLSDVDNSVRTFDLQLETNAEGQPHELPLFGPYCCRLAALPSCLVQATVSGFLNLQEDDDLSKWKRYWCSLKNLHIACWSSPDDMEVAQPLLHIPVTKSTQICDADPTTCRRAHTFLIKTVNTDGIFHHTLAADSKEELSRWWEGFQQHLLDQALWKHVCDEQMDLKVTSRRKVPTFMRKSSLYEETPLIEPDSQSEGSVGDLGLGDDQLSQMLHTLMGEASEIRSGASSTSS